MRGRMGRGGVGVGDGWRRRKNSVMVWCSKKKHRAMDETNEMKHRSGK